MTTTPNTYTAGLTEAQHRAVTHDPTAGPLAVLAGPGSGKTRVLTRRVAWLIAEAGLPADTVLALTFTNKAAGELRERLADLLDPTTADAVTATTFNAFGMSLLRRFGDLAGLPPRPRLIDSAQRRRLIRDILRDQTLFKESAAEGRASAADFVIAAIANMHHLGLTPHEAKARIEERTNNLTDSDEDRAKRTILARWHDAAETWHRFEHRCAKEGLISFDDQISRATRLLEESETARLICRTDYRAAVVDEFQDVNAAQIQMLAALFPPTTNPNLVVVGDDDQAIYGFRGADEYAFGRFEALWGQGNPIDRVTMAENFRSFPPIVALADHVIARANLRFDPDKQLTAARTKEGTNGDATTARVEVIVRPSDQLDGQIIAAMLRTMKAEDPKLDWATCAVIARKHDHIETIRAALEVEGIPCQATKRRRPADEPAVQDVMAWIELLLDPNAIWPLRRILNRPPFAIPAADFTNLEGRYLSQRSRVEQGEPEAEPLPGDGTMTDWLAAQHPDSKHAAVFKRLKQTRDQLAEETATRPASEAIHAIIRAVDPAHAEPLPGRQRAAAVTALVALISFAREREDRLEQPRDLAAFTKYHEDLDDGEKGFGKSIEDVEAIDEANDSTEASQGVALLTAHASKGLEFDTVFIPKVEDHGFPARAQPGDEDPPEGLADPLEDDRADSEIHDDEERRLFYVACTRAERRLVLLGKPTKTDRSKSFLNPILKHPNLASERHADHILTEAANAGLIAARTPLDQDAPEWIKEAERRRVVEAERRTARLDAAAALESIDENADTLEAAREALEAAAQRLAAIAAAEASNPLPDQLASDPTMKAVHARIASAQTRESPAAAAILQPRPAPLRLSYTDISEFERCPRCWYMRRVMRMPEAPGRAQVVGQAVHEALEQFMKHKQATDAGETPPLFTDPSLNDADDRTRLRALGERAFFKAWPSDEPIDPDQKDQVTSQLDRYLETLHDPDAETLEVERKIVFRYPLGEHTHQLSAKIDRIDRIEAEQQAFRVIDYKTGAATKKLLGPERDALTQLGFYHLALRAFFNDGELDEQPLKGSAEYWILSTAETGSITFEELFKKERKLREKIDNTIADMLAGQYPRGKTGNFGGCWNLCEILGD